MEWAVVIIIFAAFVAGIVWVVKVLTRRGN